MLSDKRLVRVSGLGKNFKLYKRTRDRLLELVGAGRRHEEFTALRDISFEIERGEVMGIIGENGSGKSTLLKLISGIMFPDSGEIETNGRITGLLELGTGFNWELSGRENIYLNGVYLNLAREQLARKEEEIIEFSELGEFIDQPLKSYSSGMMMRLGFSIAIHADPDCFIIDEALSVGDIRFQQKCYDRLRDFRANGGGILFVSHDLAAVKTLCNRAMVLSKGELRFLGDPEQAVNFLNELLAAKGKSGEMAQNGYGTGEVRFTSARVLNESGEETDSFVSGQPFVIEFEWDSAGLVPDVTFGFMIRDRFGQDVFGTNGALLNTLVNANGKGKGRFAVSALNVGQGKYSVNLAAHTGTRHLDTCYHWWDNAASFEITEDAAYRFSGIARLDAKLELL